MPSSQQDVLLIDFRARRRRRWWLAMAFGLGGNLIALWLSSDRATAFLGTSTAAIALYLGYLYAKDVNDNTKPQHW